MTQHPHTTKDSILVPKTTLRTAATLCAGALALALSACGSATTDGAAASSTAASATKTMSGEASSSAPMTDKPTSGATTDKAMAAGAYISLADYKSAMADYADTAVVLFFHASWCPDCKATDTSLTTDGVPDGLTVVKVDYDTETDLKKKYGITQQHTFVEVDPEQMAVSKWTGTKTGADILAKTA
ncbi:MAG: thioredoxin family protein [Nostocoides sp.]